MRKSARKSTPKRSQIEINRIKPLGVLSLETLQQKAQKVTSVNVELSDGEIYEFCHLPITVEQAEDFETGILDGSRLSKIRTLASEILVNKDGTPFATEEQLNQISFHELNKIVTAIFESARDQGGED